MTKTLLLFSIIFLLFSCSTSKGTKPTTSSTPIQQKSDFSYIEKTHKAMRHRLLGQLQESIKAYEECLSINPKDDAVYYALSGLYLQNQQLQKSSFAIEQATKLDPKNKWYLQELAYMQYDRGLYKEATKSFKKLIDLDDRNVEWLFSYTDCLIKQNDISSALKILDKLENELGKTPELSIEKFKMYRSIRQDEKAVNELTTALLEFPNDIQLLANLVDYYFEKKQDQNAFDYLILLAQNDPENGNAHLALAQYYDRKGNKSNSYSELKKAFVCEDIAIDTKLKIILSMYDLQFKLDAEMFDLINILVDKNPNNSKVFTIRGDFYMKEQKNEEALSDYKKALDFDQSKYIIWEQVLIMLYQKQDYTSLYETSKNALIYFPVMPKIYYFYSVASNQLKFYQETVDKIDAGIELLANDPSLKAEMLALKGDAYFGLKNIKDAKSSYEEALIIENQNILLKNNYAYRLALANEDLEKAENLIKSVLNKNPNESHFIDTYGWVLFQQKKYQDAQIQFEKALELKANDKHLIEHYGDVLFKLGKTSEAVQQWIKAKEMGSTNLKLEEKIKNKTYYDPIY
ncbi:MAG: tetratricopeptide repeat protein [Flavobacteriia bacterium]|nr:tetratricopeptide repeat protein [Flavobacteriia bacterium]